MRIWKHWGEPKARWAGHGERGIPAFAAMIVNEALRQAAEALAEVSDTPRLDAELLMSEAFGITRSAMLLGRMRDDAPPGFDALLQRRLGHEPVAYILGRQDFWTLTLAVSPGVLIPRADSETLIEAAIAAFHDHPPARILDLGTGSGALLLAALSHWPLSRGIGIDASAAALAVAHGNAAATGLADRAQLQLADWRTTGWNEALDGPFDLILANPPYIETDAALAPQVAQHEPHSALFAGPDGLDDYRILIPALPGLLTPGGMAVFEIGSTQSAAVRALAEGSGFDAQCCKDLAGHDRALILRPQRAA